MYASNRPRALDSGPPRRTLQGWGSGGGMQLTALQKAAAQAIVNIFETGTIRGNYGDVTLLRGDSGQLTYGRSQTTLASGNLFLLCKDYSGRTDGAYSQKLVPY